jgi:DNA-binding beta-propeller fold protein YncE
MRAIAICSALVALTLVPGARAQQPTFVNFESGPVRPLALSPDGSRLFATNTPDNRLEIFAVDAGGLTHTGSVPVGLEPVAVATFGDGEVWVVNHLSDSVSIVDVAATPPRVVRTLLVGDEPRDVVFGGTGGTRAFITTAHRGQHRTDASIAAVPGAGDPLFLDEGLGRADVWVFDANALGATLGGTPLEILTFFTDTPRALAVSADGGTVYVAGFHTGNQTTTINEGTVCNGFAGAGPCGGDGITSPGGLPGGNLPGGNPGPGANVEAVAAPEVGLIVKYDEVAGEWRDELGRNWNNGVRFDLPDEDVFAFDADTLAPVAVHAHVGTTLFNMAVHPVTGDLFVTNTEAVNHVRFEGPGVVGGSTVQGHLAEARITVVDTPDVTGSTVKPRHLNKHIDYGTLASDPGFDPTTLLHSLATPLDVVIDSAGTTLYVAAFGSSRVGVLGTAALENDTFDPTVASTSYIDVSGGGPGGLALDEAHGRLYVLTRFDNAVSVVDLGSGLEVDHLPFHSPEPPVVTDGRSFLYDAVGTSANGEASCASCHVFGDLDQLAWDLGNPDDVVTSNPMAIKLAIGAGGSVNGGAAVNEFHPMKGPMTTQTLRGLANSGPMHWRGDRANGFFGSGLGEALSFDNFIVAFEGLVGRETILSTPDMQAFTDFALTLTLPPNPVRALDNSLTPDQQAGRDFYLGSRRSDGINIENLGFTCNGCHTLDAGQGFFGTNGDASFENEEQIVKIAHLRNLYQKIGMFGMPNVPFLNGFDNGHQGDQIRGFGFLHDGSIDTLFRFFNATVFNESGGVCFDGPAGGNVKRRQMEQFMLAFDSDLAPVVGQQVTLNDSNGAAANPRIDLLIQRAQASFTSKVLGGAVTECDLVVKGTLVDEARGWVMSSTATAFISDRAIEPPTPDATLRLVAAVPGQALTYTCVPPGSGRRVGIDRDEDLVLDGDDNCPAAPNAGQEGGDMNGIGDACDLGGATTTTSSSSSTSTLATTSTTSSSTSSSVTSTTVGGSTTTSTSSSSSTSTSTSSTTCTGVTPPTSSTSATSTTLATTTTASSSTSSSVTSTTVGESTTTSTSSTSSTSTSTSSTTSTSATSSTTSTLPGAGVSGKKLVIVDRMAIGARAKVVYVSKDRRPEGIDKGAGQDVATIEVGFDVAYGNGATGGSFAVPAGGHDGSAGWRVNKAKVARFVNRAAPAGPSGAKTAVIKPGKLLKIVGKSLGDVPIDVVGAGDPGAAGITTVYTVTNGGFARRHCTTFTSCDYKAVAAGAGAKLVCKPGVASACP